MLAASKPRSAKIAAADLDQLGAALERAHPDPTSGLRGAGGHAPLWPPRPGLRFRHRRSRFVQRQDRCLWSTQWGFESLTGSTPAALSEPAATPRRTPVTDSAAHVSAVIVLAAGEGKRMRSATPKVLHEIGGRSLVGHAVAAADVLGAERLVVVVGHGRDAVAAHLAAVAPHVRTAVQDEQLGTGHAVQCALEAAGDVTGGTVVVTYGDVPLLTGRDPGRAGRPARRRTATRSPC